MREHSLAKVPVLLVVGKKEAAERTVSIRRLGSQEQKTVGLDEALAALASERARRIWPEQIKETMGRPPLCSGGRLLRQSEDGATRRCGSDRLCWLGGILQNILPSGIIAELTDDLRARRPVFRARDVSGGNAEDGFVRRVWLCHPRSCPPMSFEPFNAPSD